ncbi:MAG TPA: SxtJ family membrane protein [Opitutaceae bacterium]|nr:SxtJ family membrane protein [Opitutaceae bacterium]
MKLLRLNVDPSPRDLRLFSVLWLLFVGLAGFLAWRKGAVPLAATLWFAAGGVGAVGLVSPRKVRGVYLGAAYAAFPIGFVVSHLMLGAVYYLVLTPVGLCARLCGHDPLARRPGAAGTSYWKPRRGPRSPASYFRQH